MLSQASSSPKKLNLTLPLLLPCIFFLPSSRTTPQEYSGASTSIVSSGIMIFGVPDVGVSGSVLVKLPGLSLKFDFLRKLRARWPM
ncbi:hypothetical protein GIB67_026421 [Kingdonia uniflora]|uniref:Uncharacterized protein n=1 Tax=Kingdonia uniflora TaxID=39325 RepID=A0A7J7P6I9_9MAGN|nr:hypothetical protein GIB67_026421 [Kingdonia uniflora]